MKEAYNKDEKQNNLDKSWLLSWNRSVSGPVHKGTNHVPKAVSDRDPLPDWVCDLNLRAFPSIANAVPVTKRICALQGNILLLLRSPRLIDPCMASARISKMHTHESHSERALRSHDLRIRLLYANHDPKCNFFRVLKA